MQNSILMFSFSVFDQKHSFWATWAQKIKIVSSSWNLVLRLIQICRTQWLCSLFLFYKFSFWASLVQNFRIVSLSWNWATILVRITEFDGDVHFFYIRPKTPFLGKFGSKHQNVQFQLKIGPQSISNMQNSTVVFSFLF